MALAMERLHSATPRRPHSPPAAAAAAAGLFFYCESEQGSSCSTPFVSAPSSPSRTKNGNNSLYYYFSAPSSPPRQNEPPSFDFLSGGGGVPLEWEEEPGKLRKKHQHHQQHQHQHHRGFSFTECEFQFHSRFASESEECVESSRASVAEPHATDAEALASPSRNKKQQQQQPEEAEEMMGFYFSAPTSPDRKNGRSSKAGGIPSGCSYWDEMPGTPKMIFGGGNGHGSSGILGNESDFEFSSSRMSDSDSTVSVQMSSADELFFKGQLLPLKLRPRTNHPTWAAGAQLTSSDSSGSSNTVEGSSATGSAPHSPMRRPSSSSAASPGLKSAVMGSICGGAAATAAGNAGGSGSSGSRIRSLSPLHLFRKYHSIVTMMRPSGSATASSVVAGEQQPQPQPQHKNRSGENPSPPAADCPVPRPTRTSSKGRTLRELLHLSSVHKKNKPPPPADAPSSAAPASASASASESGKIKDLISDEKARHKQESSTSSSDPGNKSQAVADVASASSADADLAAKHASAPAASSKRMNHQRASSSFTGFDYRKRFLDRSLVGDYSKRFNNRHSSNAAGAAAAAAASARSTPSSPPSSQKTSNLRRRVPVPDLHHNYYNSNRRFHSGSIVPETSNAGEYSAASSKSGPLGTEKKKASYHGAAEPIGSRRMFHSGPILDKSNANTSDSSTNSSSNSSGNSKRFANGAAAAAAMALAAAAGEGSKRWDGGVYHSTSSASSSRNVSPRRNRQGGGGGNGGGGGISLHELHYKAQRANSEELRRKTFLPYKQGLLGCLGCATMRIAGLSKSLQPMASSR